jgi:hypothetical protein
MKLQNPHQFYKRVLIIWGLLILLVSSIPSLSLPLPDKLGFLLWLPLLGIRQGKRRC